MIPDFDDRGNLPPGIHPCTLDEVRARFGHGSSEREVETAELAEFIAWARRAGIQRVLVDGSYVTTKRDSNDVDIVILPGAGYPRQEGAALSLTNRWPFVHVMVASDAADLERWVRVEFGTDRTGTPRGILEIEL